MSIQFKRGTTAQHATYTGAVGEMTFDTDKKVAVLHDGLTAGGWPQGAGSNIAIATTGGTTTLTSAQSVGTSFEFSGVLTSNKIYVVPNNLGIKSFKNLHTGPFTVIVKTAAGTGFTINQGEKVTGYANGTNAETLSIQVSGTMAAFGYRTFPAFPNDPSPLILQWGSVAATPAGLSVTFPIAFSVMCFAVYESSATTGMTVGAQGITTTGFGAFSSGTYTTYWLAIGK